MIHERYTVGLFRKIEFVKKIRSLLRHSTYYDKGGVGGGGGVW